MKKKSRQNVVLISRAFGSVISVGGRQNTHIQTGPSPSVCTSFSSYLVVPDFPRIGVPTFFL